MKKYKVGIVGYGVVGKGIHRVLGDDVVAVYDPIFTAEPHKTKSLSYPGCNFGFGENARMDFDNLDLVVICVMTKENKDGTCDTSIVDESIEWVHEVNPKAVVLVKSAVVPSEIQRIYDRYFAVSSPNNLRLVVSPEYMGESRYFTPEWKYPHPERMESHTWQIFGGNKSDTTMCVDIFKRHMGVDCQFMQTDLMTAALCKYMENSFFAMKVTFSNEFYDIAQVYGVDYNELRELWAADPRVGKNHTLVFPENRGYKGKCFPKDVKAIIADSKKKGYTPKLLEAVDKVNEEMVQKSL